MATKLLATLNNFSGGLNEKVEPNMIADTELAIADNVLLIGNQQKAIPSKRYGYIPYSNSLSNPITKIYDFYKNDLTKEFLAVSGTSLYKDNNGILTQITDYFKYSIIESCDAKWDEKTVTGVTSDIDKVDKKTGVSSVKLTIVDTVSAGTILATKKITSTDLSNGISLNLWIKSSVAVASGDLQLLLDDTAQCASPVHSLSIPALTADTWTQVPLPYDKTVTGSNAIVSIGIKMVVDKGAFTLRLDDIQVKSNTVLSNSDNVQMLTYKDREINDVALIADGGKLKVYDGTKVLEVLPHTPTASDSTATPAITGEDTDPGLNDLANLTTFRAIAIKKDRLFAAAHPTVKNRISFCHHDPGIGYAVYDYWPASFFFDVAADENDQITTLKVFRDNLVIFCNRSAWLLKGDGRTLQDYELDRLNVPNGCISPKSVCIVGNFLFYLSNDHVYAMSSTEFSYVSAQIVSQNVEKTLKSISLADKKKAVGTFHDNKYYLSFPNGVCLVYDSLLNAWTKWTNVKANSFLDRDGVLFFCSDSGHIYKFDENTWNDDGSPISFTAATKRLDFGLPVQKKNIKKAWTIARQYDALSSNFNLSANIDYVTVNIKDITTDQSLVWDEGNWDETYWDFVDVVKTTTKINESGENIQFIISNNNLNEPLTIYGLVMQYTVKKPK